MRYLGKCIENGHPAQPDALAPSFFPISVVEEECCGSGSDGVGVEYDRIPM